MARLVALRYGGESVLASGCLCDSTGALYRLFSVARDMTTTPLAQGKPQFCGPFT